MTDEENIISLALLRSVLGREDIISHHLSGRKNSKIIHYSTGYTDYHQHTIGTYELANRCKLWAFDNGYQIATYKSKHKWIAKDPFKGYPYEGADSEPEVTIKACEWIKENKK